MRLLPAARRQPFFIPIPFAPRAFPFPLAACCQLPAASCPFPLPSALCALPYAPRAYLYGTRSSPWRRVIRIESRYSRYGMAYFRETPNNSFIVPTLMFGCF
jgi:hypothetical protein